MTRARSIDEFPDFRSGGNLAQFGEEQPDWNLRGNPTRDGVYKSGKSAPHVGEGADWWILRFIECPTTFGVGGISHK